MVSVRRESRRSFDACASLRGGRLDVARDGMSACTAFCTPCVHRERGLTHSDTLPMFPMRRPRAGLGKDGIPLGCLGMLVIV